ncbi:MAG: hypothetical protein NZ960_01975 [Candidatus Kapabacteria bacterium]|nr:hypothetical protein [Candidatus Kapabacteria bacterium]MDW8011792.1 hypothetical protein [Bacteroidota bacterium]
MKLVFSLAVVTFIVWANVAFAQIHLGVGLCFGSDIEKPGIDLRGYYGLSPTLRLTPNFHYFFTESGTSFWTIDLNAHYIFYEHRRQQRAYGLFGLQYARRDIGFETVSDSEIGLNVGIGGETRVDFGAIFGEIKFVLGGAEQLVIGAGLRFSL